MVRNRGLQERETPREEAEIRLKNNSHASHVDWQNLMNKKSPLQFSRAAVSL